MKNKVSRVIILISFVMIICMPNLIWSFFSNYLDAENYENRQMAEKPVLTFSGYSSFSTDFTEYYDDNLPFRNYLIQMNSCVDYFLFKKSSSENVIVGDDYWLFYCREDDGDPLGCYQGTNLLSIEELDAIAQNCINQRDFLLAQGKEFIIFIAPNKERVYYEYLPTRYGAPAENYQALQIYTYLKNYTDLRVVYPYAEIMDAKEKVSTNIWYKTDTHWNYIGGYVGASALLSELGIEMPKVYSEAITISEIGETSGDLAWMLNLSRQLSFADTEYFVDGYDLHNREELEWDFPGMIRYHATNADPRSIYVIRDSFSSNMALYIGSQFTDSYLRHRDSYSYDELISCDPDVVVYETAERYANILAYFSIQ